MLISDVLFSNDNFYYLGYESQHKINYCDKEYHDCPSYISIAFINGDQSQQTKNTQ